MGEVVINTHTSVVPLYTSQFSPGTSTLVYVSTCSNVGHLVTVRDMDGYLSSPQSILVSTTAGVQFTDGSTSRRLRQGFDTLTMRATASNRWAIVDRVPLSNPADAYAVRGISYRTIDAYGLVQITSSMSVRDLIARSSVQATEVLATDGALYGSTVVVQDLPRFLHTVTDANNFVVAGGTYLEGFVSTMGAFSAQYDTLFGSNVVATGPVSTLSNALIGSSVTISNAGAPIAVTDLFTVAAPIRVEGPLTTEGPFQASAASFVRGFSTGTLSTTALSGTPVLTSSLILSTGTATYLTNRADITVVDPAYTGTTNPIVEIQPGLAITSNFFQRAQTIVGSAGFLQTSRLQLQGSIQATGLQALALSSATLLNSNGSYTGSTIATANLVVSGSITQPLSTIQPTNVTTSSLFLTQTAQISGPVSAPAVSAATTSSIETVATLADTGGVEVLTKDLTLSTLTISSAALLGSMSSLVLQAGTIQTTGGLYVGSNTSTSAATVSSVGAVSTIRSADTSTLTLSSSQVVLSTVTLSTLLTTNFNVSTLTTQTINLGAPLSYSTISPLGPWVSTSTSAGLTSNTQYEWVKGLGTIYNPLQIKASVDRTVNIYLNQTSSVNSTFYLNVEMNYRNDGSASGVAGLRTVNQGVQSTILSFNANPIQGLQTATLSNFLIPSNLSSVTTTYYLDGAVTLQVPSTVVNQEPLVVAGSSGTTLGLYNQDGRLQTFTAFSTTSTAPFSNWNRVLGDGTVWRAAGAGSASTLAYSYDGRFWYGLSNTVFSTRATGLAWNRAGRWVATGQGTNTLALSLDGGTTWTGLGTSIFSTRGNCVAWNGTMFVAGGTGTNTIAYSYNGSNWTGLGSSVFTTEMLDVAWGSNVWIGVGAGTSNVAKSYDGINWSTMAVPLGTQGQAVAWSGSRWLVGGGTGSGDQLAYSDDATTWTNVNISSIMSTVYGITWTGQQWAITGARVTFAVATSPDGVSWSGTALSPASALSNGTTISGRAALPTGLSTGTRVVLGGTSNPNVAFAPQPGAAWTTTTVPSLSTIHTVAYNGRYWLLTGVAGSDTNYTAVTSSPTYYSDTGASWSSIGATGPFGYGYGLAWNGFLWVATGSRANGSTIATSADGITWTGQSNTVFTSTGRGVAWGSNKFVATGQGSNALAYTLSGSNWIGLGSNVTSSGRTVAWSGSRWVGGGTGPNTLFYSSDGITWTGLSTTVFSQQANSVAWNGSLWVAGGRGTNTLATSPDGITWTGQGTAPFSNAVNAVAWAGSNWIITGEAGLSNYTTFRSADGSNWTPDAQSLLSTGTALAADSILPSSTTFDQVFIATGDSGATKMSISQDGSNWISTPGPFAAAFSGALTSIVYNGNLWVVGGTNPFGSPFKPIYYSFNGLSWSPQTTGFSQLQNVFGIAWGNGKFVAVGQPATDPTATWATSTDGINWTQQFGGTFGTTPQMVAWGGNRWLVGTTGGVPGIKVSVDNATTWSSINVLSGGGNGFFTGAAAAYNGSMWVVGGDFSGFGYSLDGGLSFRFLSNNVTPIANVLSIAYGNGVWVGVGAPGGIASNSIAYSTDGINWTGVPGSSNIFNFQCRGVSWNGKVFVAIGEHFSLTNTLAISPDGSNWTGLGVKSFQGAFSRGHKIASRRVLPTISTPGIDPPTVQEGRMFTWNFSNVNSNSQTSIFKSGGGAAWNASGWSSEGYSSNAYLSFQPGQTNGSVAMGLAENPTGTTSFTGLTYAVYLSNTGTAFLYEFGTQVATVGSYLTTDTFRITYDGSNVRFYQNSNLLRTTARPIGSALYLDSSFFTLAAVLSNIEYHPLYRLTTTAPSFTNTGFVFSEAAGTGVDQAAPFYLSLTGDLVPSSWSLFVTLSGTLSNLGTSFYADVFFNETFLTSTNIVSPSYLTTSTYTLTFSTTSTISATSNDTLNLRFRATRGAGTTYLYTSYAGTSNISSVAARVVPNAGAIEYLQFFHTSFNTGLQTSELSLYAINASTSISTSYIDSNAGLSMNLGYVKWNSPLNTTTIRNRYNDITTNRFTYTGSLYNASDPALKTCIEPADLPNLLSTIGHLPLHRYRYIDAYQAAFRLADRTQLGVLATEVAAALPQAVGPAPALSLGPATPSNLLTVDRTQLRAAHLGATKALLQRVEALQQRLTALRSRTT